MRNDQGRSDRIHTRRHTAQQAATVLEMKTAQIAKTPVFRAWSSGGWGGAGIGRYMSQTSKGWNAPPRVYACARAFHRRWDQPPGVTVLLDQGSKDVLGAADQPAGADWNRQVLCNPHEATNHR